MPPCRWWSIFQRGFIYFTYGGRSGSQPVWFVQFVWNLSLSVWKYRTAYKWKLLLKQNYRKLYTFVNICSLLSEFKAVPCLHISLLFFSQSFENLYPWSRSQNSLNSSDGSIFFWKVNSYTFAQAFIKRKKYLKV